MPEEKFRIIFETVNVETFQATLDRLVTTANKAGVVMQRNLAGGLGEVSKRLVRVRGDLKAGNISLDKAVNRYQDLKQSLKILVSEYNRLSKLGRKGFPDPETTKRLNVAVQKFRTLEGAIRKQTTAMRGLGAATGTVTQQTGMMSITLDSAIGKLIKYRLSYLILRKAMEGIKVSVGIFSDINYELAQLDKVINPLNTNLQELKDAAFELSKEFSISAQSILKAFNIWARVGLSQNEILEATRSTLIGVNAIGLNTVDMTEALTAVIFTYGIEVNQTTQYINEWLRVQAKFPVAARDLANALKAVGSAAKQMGVDLTELSGYVTAVNAITRKSGRAIGNSLKTIFARIPKKETIKAFQEIGIAIKASETEFRDVDDILDDLSVKWDTLTGVQKQNIAQTSAGIRRYVDFLALMDAYSLKQQAIVEGTLATTEALRASNIEVESFKKQIELLKIEASELGESFGAELAVGIKSFVGILSGLISAFKTLSPILSPLIRGLLTIGLVLGTVKVASAGFGLISRLTTKAIIANTAAVYGLDIANKQYTLSTAAAAAGTNVFAFSLRGLVAALGPVGIAFAVISTALAIFPEILSFSSNELGKHKTALDLDVESLKKRTRALDKQNTIIDSSLEKYINLVKQYQELKLKGEDVSDVVKKMGVEEETLASISDGLAIATLKVRSALNETVISFDDVSEAADKAKKSNEAFIDINKKLFDQAKKSFELTRESEKRILDRSIASAESTLNTIDSLSQKLTNLFRQTYSFSDLSDAYTRAIEDAYNQVQSRFKRLSEGGLGLAPTLYEVDLGPVYREFSNFADKVRKKWDRELKFEIADPKKREEIKAEIDGIVGIIDGALKDKKITFPISDVKGLDDLRKKSQSYTEEFTTLFFILDKYLLSLSKSTGVSLNELYNQLDEFEKRSKLFSEDIFANLGEVTPDTSYFQISAEGITTLSKALKRVQSSFVLAANEAERLKANNIAIGLSANEVEKATISYYSKLVKDGQNVLNKIERLKEEAKLTAEDLTIKFRFEADKDTKITDADLKVQLAGVDAGLDTQLKKLDDLKDKYAEIINQYVQQYLGLQLDIRDAIDETKIKSELLNQAIKAQISGYKLIVNLLKTAGKNEAFILDYKLKSLELIRDQKIAQAVIIDDGKQQNRILAIQADYLREQRDLAFQIATIDYAKNLKIAIAAGKEFRNTLARAFASVPDVVTEGAEKRKDLTRELKELELELAAARLDGEHKAIAELENRIKKIKDELHEVRSFAYELKTIFQDLFGGIQDIVFKNAAEQFAEEISKIQLGDFTLADKVGAAIASVNQKYLFDLTYTNDGFISNQQTIFNSFLSDLARIMNVQGFVPSGIPVIQPTAQEIKFLQAGGFDTSAFDGTFTEGSDKMSDVLKTGANYMGLVIARSLTTAIAGTGQGAQLGAGIGSTLGSIIATAIPGWGAALAGLGGLIGGIFGGTFDEEIDIEEPIRDLSNSVIENSRSIDANTNALKELDSSIINAPSTFIQPAFSVVGGPSRIVNIVIHANDATDVATKVSQVLEDEYETSIRTNRTTRRYDV